MSEVIEVAEKSKIYFGAVERLLDELLPSKRVVIISDTTIEQLYPELIARFPHILIGVGESIKTLDTVRQLYRRLVDQRVDRSCFLLGIGGGIVTDITGFAATTFMRGVEFGFVSTTLLGQVDASVGGKNGVNLDGYKNMVGTFSQPRFVIGDMRMLDTLPDREFRSGLSEIVKSAVIADTALFELLEASTFEQLRSDKELLCRIVAATVNIKADIVARDERESGERRKLNLGHTIAHAIEKCSTKMSHGEAVAVGLAAVAGAAVRCGVADNECRERIVSLLERFGFDLTPPVGYERLVRAMQKDKKSDGGGIYIILPAEIGRVEVSRMTIADFAALL